MATVSRQRIRAMVVLANALLALAGLESSTGRTLITTSRSTDRMKVQTMNMAIILTACAFVLSDELPARAPMMAIEAAKESPPDQ